MSRTFFIFLLCCKKVLKKLVNDNEQIDKPKIYSLTKNINLQFLHIN